jgi:hypothetical protein
MRFAIPALVLVALSARGAEPTPEDRFRTDVWPLLERSCVRCHGVEKQKSGLRLDSREAALKGGESGTALVPGKPEESLLLRLARHAEADRKMPPKEKLHDAELASLERWIADGAPWPALAVAAAEAPANGEKLGDAWADPRNPIVQIFGGKRLDLWSLRPLSDPAPPEIRNPKSEIRNPIDAFILSRLEAVGATPAPDADARTLCRRLYFDLIGLPPTSEQMETFVREYHSPVTDHDSLIATTADTLLASPQYGEHWARMWLDVVRYSDSNGFDWDEFRPQAWRFRDYVIRALNTDKPFDRFLREQLAGDEMLAGPPRDAAEQDCLIATTYLRLGPHDNTAGAFAEGPRVRAALMNDLVETTGAACLGLTLSCARCHNHKFDPVSQADYYRLRAFFEGVKFRDDLPIDLAPEQDAIRQHNEALDAQISEQKEVRDTIVAPVKERLRAERIAKLSAEDQALLALPADQRDEPAKKKVKALEKKIAPAADAVKAALAGDEKDRAAVIDQTIAELKQRQKPYTTGLLAADENATPPVTNVLFQGDITKPREAVVPGFLSVLDPNPAPIAKPARENSSGRRTALADWLVSDHNPLVARVLVNRIWQGHFGEGLVATPNDFGLNGARPTHPELLDYLAREFIHNRWSLKKLHRLIVTSATYRQGSARVSRAVAGVPPASGSSLRAEPPPPPSTPDPSDSSPDASRSPRRLTAEALRDSMLAVAGRLLPCEGGPPIWPEVPDEILRVNPAFLDDNAEKTKGWYPTPREQTGVRSIYLVQKRTMHVPLMETFDLPDNTLSCPRRIVSTVAPQALTLLNSPFATEMASAFAARLQREAGDDPAAQIDRAFHLALQRRPDETERTSCVQFRTSRSLPELCRALLNLNEFAYID